MTRIYCIKFQLKKKLAPTKTYYKTKVIKPMWYLQNNRQVNQRNRISFHKWIHINTANLSLTKDKRKHNEENISFSIDAARTG